MASGRFVSREVESDRKRIETIVSIDRCWWVSDHRESYLERHR